MSASPAAIKIVEDLLQLVKQAAKKTDPNPTEKEKKDGTYAMGKVKLQGLPITIETPKGAKRSGKDENGKPWSVTMPAYYGYIDGTVGRDKDHLDIYIGPDPEQDGVYIVNQNTKEGKFDEHKIMFGFPNQEAAVKTYDAAFTGDLGPKLRQSVVATTVRGLKEWIETGRTKDPFKLPVSESMAKLLAA